MNIDTQLLKDRLLSLLREYKIPIGIGCIGLLFLVYGLILLFGQKSEEKDVIFDQSTANAQVPSTKIITVDVSGAVVAPKVYLLKDGSRIQDALIAAGGLGETADRAWVGKYMNLAQPLIDGQKVYIPSKNEQTAKSTTQAVAGTSTEASGMLNINTATASELDTLPGVGPVTAQKIIAGRPYTTLEELTQKKVVSTKVFGQIKEKVSIY